MPARLSGKLTDLTTRFFVGHPVIAKSCLLVAYFVFVYVFWARPLLRRGSTERNDPL